MDQQENKQVKSHMNLLFIKKVNKQILMQKIINSMLYGKSIYDVCKLIKFGIIEDITEEEFEEAYAWLKTTQSLTEDYQELELEF